MGGRLSLRLLGLLLLPAFLPRVGSPEGSLLSRLVGLEAEAVADGALGRVIEAGVVEAE